MKSRSVVPPSDLGEQHLDIGLAGGERASISVWMVLTAISSFDNKKSGRAPTSGPATGPEPMRKL